jgi:putative ABC transport system permease protein
MIKNNLKTAWRNMIKRKGFTLINVGGLALGMASCLLLTMYISYHLNFDRQFDNIDRIYVLENNQAGNGNVVTVQPTPGPLAAAIANTVPGVERAVRTTSYTASGLITYKDNSFKKEGLFADQDFFSLFSYKFISGSAASALANPNSIVITRNLAVTLFGNADPINKTIKRNDSTELMVSGVIENVPENSTLQFDYVLPWKLAEHETPFIKTAGWTSNFCLTFVQLKGTASFKEADVMVRQLINKNQSDYKAEAMLFPFSKSHLYDRFENGRSVGGLIEQIHLFMILAVCILLIACINFMNLSTARSEERAREVGIRKAIGSTRYSLIVQFIVESILLSFLATVLAVLIMAFSLPYFSNLLNIQLGIPFDNKNAWFMLAGLTLITGLISGSYPAFYLSSFKPTKVLKGVFKGGGKALPLRKILVVIQFTFAVFLITATICIYRQIKFIQNRPIGFDKNNLVELSLEGGLTGKTNVLIDKLKSEIVITGATSLSQSITSDMNTTWSVNWPGKQVDKKTLFGVMSVGYDFVRTIGVKLTAGREFSEQFQTDASQKTVMINEAAAKVMNLAQPVGTVIKYNDQDLTIVGVYKDFVWGSPYKKTGPMVTLCATKGNGLALRLNPNKTLVSCIDLIQKEARNLNPAYPAIVKFADNDFDKKFKNEKLLGLLANLFGGLAVVISCLGLFGLAAYAAEQRIKEIGVRKVLGASVANLTMLLSKDFLKLVIKAIIIAIPLSAYIMNKWLNKYEFHISLSWWIIVLASVITIIVAMLTVSYQAMKAALSNPVKSIRNE